MGFLIRVIRVIRGIRMRISARSLRLNFRGNEMNVSVTVDLSVEAQEKHVAQMRSAALSVTDNPSSVRVICPSDLLKQICALFTVPDARQADVVGHIGRNFWNVENYSDSSIGFSEPGREHRTLRRRT
jgi:hypothetical protein